MPTGSTPKTDATTAFVAYRQSVRFQNLDGLRFICIFMVLWHHFPLLDSSVLQVFGKGFLGVDFFFVLSGFLITTLLLREIDAKGSFSMRNFYIRRALRIVPVYFFVVTCVLAYFIFAKGQTELITLAPYYYLFLSSFLTDHAPFLSITWSLSVEEQYYMIWPLLLLILPQKLLVPVSIILIVVNVVVGLGLINTAPWAIGALVLKIPTATYAPIVMGSLAAIMLHRPSSFAPLFTLCGWRSASVAGFLALFAIIQFGPDDIIGLPNLAIHTTMTFILVSLTVRHNTPMTGFLTHPAIMRVGAISYGIYLYHLIALHFVTKIASALGEPAVFILYLALSYLLAELSFRTLETYFQKFRPKAN